MAKVPRGDFALPGGTKTNKAGAYPMNTPGRVKAAPGLAARSEKKGNITPAQEAKVDRMAASKRGEKPDPKTPTQIKRKSVNNLKRSKGARMAGETKGDMGKRQMAMTAKIMRGK